MSKEPTERERLLEAHRAHVRAMRERDYDAMARLFDPDCLIFDGPSPVLQGWKKYRKRLEKRLSGFGEFRLRAFDEFARVDERLDDRIGWIAARYEIRGKRDGKPYRESGRWTGIYEKRNDAWKVVHLHLSPDPQKD